MATFRASPESTRLILLLFAATLAEGVVLYTGTDPWERLGLGVLLIAPIVWASARLGVVERLTRAWGNRRYQRRFLKLRYQVDRMIEEVRRMNWAAFDHRRGLKSDEVAQRELDAIEDRLIDIIRKLRESAGEMSSEEEDAGPIKEIAAR
jgi:hypothetical protein